jgi:hypothetical protein
MYATLIAFFTALFGKHGATREMACRPNWAAIKPSNEGMWIHAATGHRLVRPDLDPAHIPTPTPNGTRHAVALLIPIGLSLVSPAYLSPCTEASCWVLPGHGMVRGEVAVVWRPA